MASSDPAETERVIRQKLESSGQYGKMRAMIMEAALQTVQSSSSSDNSSSSNGNGAIKPNFAPSAALVDAKANGVVELSVVLDYLRALGLQYTESVLCLEAGLSAVPLQTSADLQHRFSVAPSTTCLTALVRGGGAAAGGGGAAAAAPVTQPVVPPTPAAVEEPSEDEDREGSDDASETSNHNQPGAEDSTYYISKWTKRHFVRFQQVTGQQVQLDRLSDCHTVVLDELDSMTVDDCEGGELVVAACEGSVFLRNCKNMTVHVACKQLRTRDCANIDFHIFTTTDPVVEMSHNMHFYPFHLRLPSQRKLFAEARLDAKLNRFVHVYDFTPSEPSLPQPHFQVHFPDHQQAMEDRCATYGTPECPQEIEQLLALQLMPAASSESGKNKSYDIKTGAQVWAAGGGVSAAPVAAATAAAGAAVLAAAPVASAGAPAVSAMKVGGASSGSDDHSSVHSSSVSDVESDSEVSGSDDSDGAAAAAAKVRKLSGGGAVPAVKAPAAAAATPGGLDNEEYSSFDDESDGHDVEDKYEVDEDEDDF